MCCCDEFLLLRAVATMLGVVHSPRWKTMRRSRLGNNVTTLPLFHVARQQSRRAAIVPYERPLKCITHEGSRLLVAHNLWSDLEIIISITVIACKTRQRTVSFERRRTPTHGDSQSLEWQKLQDEYGREYYYNPATGATAWVWQPANSGSLAPPTRPSASCEC